MTAFTSTQSGLASANSTWGGGGHPSANADTFIVSVGHDVEWDLDLTGLSTGLGASTISGTLHFSRTAGSYGFKMNNAVLTVAGTLDASNGSGGAYPSTCTATITGTGATFAITTSGVGVLNLICGEPTHKYAKLSQAESSGQAVIHVDTDLTADALWANNNLVRVDNVAQAPQSEQYTISSVTSTQITLTTNLSNSKLIGSYVILVSRNVKITGNTTGTAINIGTVTNLIGAEIRAFATGIASGSLVVINGTITGCTTAVSNTTAYTINAVMSGGTTAVNGGSANIITGLISGFTNAVSAGLSQLISGATITGCTAAVTASISPSLINATLTGCATAVNQGSGLSLRNVSMSSNTQDFNRPGSGVAQNTLFGSTTEFLNYTNSIRQIYDYVESLDHDQVVGAFRAWCRGGIVSSVASPVYDSSRVRSYDHVPESATLYVFRQQQVWVPPGGSVVVRCFVQKSVSMSFLPRLWVFSADKEPFITGSPDAAVLMTDSINTWEVLSATVTNSTNALKPYIVRTLAQNATGHFYADPIIRVSNMLFQQEASMAA